MTQTFSDWIGRTEIVEDVPSVSLVEGLLATLDHDVPKLAAGDFAPQSIHWCLGATRARASELGPDGHPKLGGFLPPVPLPRRMWAASALEFLAPIRIGSAVTRRSTLAGITEKHGASGRLVFVDVDHMLMAEGIEAVRERQTLVYRDSTSAAPEGATKAQERAANPEWTWQRELTPDPVMLFRYSALTFNGHRIHYDLPYATGAEGYPGLVVHGPLTATLLLDLCARHLGPNALSSFTFRGVSAAFAGAPLRLAARRDGRSLSLAALGPDERVVMKGQATIAGCG